MYWEQEGSYRQDPANSGENSNWYPRTAASSVRAASPERSGIAGIRPNGRESSPASSWWPAGSSQRVAELGFKRAEVGIEHVPTRDDHDIQARGNVGVPEQLADQALGPVTDHRSTDLPGGGNSETAVAQRIAERHHRHEPRADPGAMLVDLQELRATPNPRGGRKRVRSGLSVLHEGPRDSAYEETLRRLRPFARRRFNTRRPPLLAIRTRNPWVLCRRRLLG
jgi:hypothetical protein